jgi:hypothetical protein
MSKLDIKNEVIRGIAEKIDTQLNANQKVIDMLQDEKRQEIKRFEKEEKKTLKKIKKLFGRVNTNITLNENECIVKINNEKVFTLNYNEFSFLNIDRELGLDIKTLFEDLYGEPKEKSLGNYIYLTGGRGNNKHWSTMWYGEMINKING